MKDDQQIIQMTQKQVLMGLCLLCVICAVCGYKMAPKANPHSIVIIGGDKYDSWVDKSFFKQVTVELTSNQASQGLFRCFDPRFRFLDKYSSGDGIPPLPMLFYMGFGEDLGQPIFKGILQRAERGDSDTTLRAHDVGVKMRQEKKKEYHNNLHDLAIIEKLARRNGLNFEGPDSALALEPHPSMPQDTKNDWEHSIERARDAGLVLYVRQDTLFAKEPARIKAPIFTLIYRQDFWVLHNFDLTYKIPENQFGRNREVEWMGRKKGGKRLTGRSKKHRRGTKLGEIRKDLAIHSKGYADRRAHASKELQREHAFVCNVRSIPPLPGVRPDFRDTIVLQQFGKLFSGPYLVDKVSHDHSANDFITEYQLYRDIG